MINSYSREGIHTFSHSDFQRSIINQLDKFALFCILFLVVFSIAKTRYISAYGIISLLFLCMLTYLYGKILKKFAYKIIVDFDSSKLLLHMYRSKIITADFEDLKSIRVNGYVIFMLEDGKVFYNDLRNKDLLACLNKIVNIRWGPLCALWGPDKEVRDSLDALRPQVQSRK